MTSGSICSRHHFSNIITLCFNYTTNSFIISAIGKKNENVFYLNWQTDPFESINVTYSWNPSKIQWFLEGRTICPFFWRRYIHICHIRGGQMEHCHGDVCQERPKWFTLHLIENRFDCGFSPQTILKLK